MDIATPHGTPLFAAANGTVEHCGPDQFYQPIHVDIRDDQGRLHIMGHMSSASGDLAVGGRVSAGQPVGLSGTPPGAGAHVHYELRDARGCAIDPEPALVNGAVVQMAVFEPRDVIRVADGPVRLRKGTGTDSAIVAELVTGTKLCVLAGPEEATGFTWYRVRLQLDNSGGEGWVAGRYCELVEKGACD